MKKKKNYTHKSLVIENAPGCPIYTSIMSPQQYYRSLNKVRTYTHCKLLTFAGVLPPLFTSFSIQWSPFYEPDGGSRPVPPRGSEVIFHGMLSARQQQQAVSYPSLLRWLLAARTAYALGTLDADPLASICVCAVKFNQDGICWCLM